MIESININQMLAHIREQRKDGSFRSENELIMQIYKRYESDYEENYVGACNCDCNCDGIQGCRSPEVGYSELSKTLLFTHFKSQII